MFCHPTLFVHSKNTKLEYITSDLNTVFAKQNQSQSAVTDPVHYSTETTFVDLGKQITSEHSDLPDTGATAEFYNSEVYLWRRCCLESYINTRRYLRPDSLLKRGQNLRCTKFVFATIRDCTNITLFANNRSTKRKDSLVYSQFYSLIKTLFNTAKAYVFNQEALENLALDPGFVRSEQQEGRAVTFSKLVLKRAYHHIKERAATNLRDSQRKSYGIREEHRITLTMMYEIDRSWTEADLYTTDPEPTPTAPLPYYMVPTEELFGFIYGQINKFCFMFEQTLTHTPFKSVSLAESAVIIVALRALRFCYCSNILALESLLQKD